ncbi:MAG: DUF5330 domain-containing protein [Hyphomicrobiales bacterium]
MVRLIKVCFWIAVVVMFLPEDITSNKNNQSLSVDSAIEVANIGLKNASEFCTKNPNACLQGKEAAASISQKTINTARTIYDYLNKNSSQDDKNGLEQIFVQTDTLSIEDQIKLAKSTGQTLSVSDLNIDFSSLDVQ